MRKFIFILFLIPIFASLGHDIYIFKENPDKGFRLSALGALWDKYHKESHDQWKDKVRAVTVTVSEAVEDLTPDNLMNMTNPEETTTPDENSPEEEPSPFMEGFTQADSKGKETEVKPLQIEEPVETQANTLMKFIGFTLEQKAVFVFSALAALIYILNAFFSRLFRPRESMGEIKSMKKQKRKGGGYAYGRK